jgi:hypothetical protein
MSNYLNFLVLTAFIINNNKKTSESKLWRTTCSVDKLNSKKGYVMSNSGKVLRYVSCSSACNWVS